MDESTARGVNESPPWPSAPDDLGADDAGDAELTSEFEAAPIETPTETMGYAPPDSGPAAGPDTGSYPGPYGYAPPSSPYPPPAYRPPRRRHRLLRPHQPPRRPLPRLRRRPRQWHPRLPRPKRRL